MSGGHFDYQQYKIGEIADEVERLVRTNNTPDEWGDARNYSDKTIKNFIAAVKILRIAEIYAQRVDWLVSGDDCEESFDDRLEKDLRKLFMEQNK